MEPDLAQPIVSVSLGCDGVFLLGGRTLDEEPTALLLRSGDVVVMTASARLHYHGAFLQPARARDWQGLCSLSASHALLFAQQQIAGVLCRSAARAHHNDASGRFQGRRAVPRRSRCQSAAEYADKHQRQTHSPAHVTKGVRICIE